VKKFPFHRLCEGYFKNSWSGKYGKEGPGGGCSLGREAAQVGKIWRSFVRLDREKPITLWMRVAVIEGLKRKPTGKGAWKVPAKIFSNLGDRKVETGKGQSAEDNTNS